MRGLPGLKSVNLVNGAGMVVRIVNENIATIQEVSNVNNPPNRREFWITSASPGVTFVHVFGGPNNTTLAGRLEVNVKDEILVPISFQFVKDSLFTKTARPSSIADELLDTLNDIYIEQANIRFKKMRAMVDVPVDTTLLNIVTDQKNQPGRQPPSWDKLIAAADPGADVNVFFMPWSGTAAKRPAQILTGWDGSRPLYICEDSMPTEGVKVALPHCVGIFLGCSATFSDRQIRFLMFSGRADGLVELAGMRPFIPKDCANTMNPDLG